MKKIVIGVALGCLFGFPVMAEDIDDNSIIDELNKENTQELDIDFSLKSFESCEDFETVMEEYIRMYWKNSYKNGYAYQRDERMLFGLGADDMDFAEQKVTKTTSSVENSVVDGVGGVDFSETNVQVSGVDESDIVKTDGKYHYYYNETEKAVYIITTKKSGESLKVVKKINIPETFSGIQLYIGDNRLVILATGYSNAVDYYARGYYVNRNIKTYTIVFDTSDIENPKLERLYSSDGYFSKSRKIGDYLYVLSENSFNFPYWNYTKEEDIEFDAEMLLPKKLDISRTDTEDKQNLTISGKSFPYNVAAGNVAACNEISYNLPDEETLKEVNFNPGFNIISIINIQDTSEKVHTHVVAGSNTEIYMSLDNLYLTEGIWQTNNFSCPPGAICAMPFFWGGTQNTLVHKLNIDKNNIEYQDSALIPGSPLNQYSMDEHKGNFRIITSVWSPERSTGVYILDESLSTLSSLTNLAPGETFQSSRFIGDKLFLVTFEQIDPLFAIDLGDDSNPKVLGELKIPGYSTYLHPYDETHLIGLGYDTKENKWGGTETSGVKVDLYKIHYDKKCGDDTLTASMQEKCESGDYKGIIVEQLYTKTMGGRGSSSEALSNPRMFVWNANRNVLLLPVTLYERDDSWNVEDYFNGLAAIHIDENNGIQIENQVSHIDMSGLEEKREQECEKYTGNTTETCRELINGEIYCETETKYNYIPEYCYKDATIWQYIGQNSWNFREMFIKRALYIDDEVYAISDSQVSSYDWDLQERETESFE